LFLLFEDFELDRCDGFLFLLDERDSFSALFSFSTLYLLKLTSVDVGYCFIGGGDCYYFFLLTILPGKTFFN
jgi:hypothetical protein